jgi:hypothetical protein
MNVRALGVTLPFPTFGARIALMGRYGVRCVS